MSLRSSISILVVAAALASCDEPKRGPTSYKASVAAQKLPPELRAKTEAALTKYFGTPANPVAYNIGDLDSGLDAAKLAGAADQFLVHCGHCHAVSGDGNGTTAAFLNPRPRDFRSGKFKFKSTEYQAKPTRDDLRRVLTDGVNFTAMPSFGLFEESFRESMVEYIILLSMRGEVEGSIVADNDAGEDVTDETIADAARRVMDSWKGTEAQIVKPGAPKPEYSDASVARGKDIFLKGAAQCGSCHGDDGTGNSAKGQTDDWGFATKPSDLTKGIYRGGGRPIDLYRRISAGIKGSPMPGFGNQLSPEQIWDLVHFVQSLNKNRS